MMRVLVVNRGRMFWIFFLIRVINLFILSLILVMVIGCGSGVSNVSKEYEYDKRGDAVLGKEGLGLYGGILSNVVGKVSYSYIKVIWETRHSGKLSTHTSIVRDERGDIYSGIDDNGQWLGMIIPVMYLEGNRSFGISLIFVRSSKGWKFSYVKAMNLLPNAKDGYSWADRSRYSILVKDTTISELNISLRHHFVFKYKGTIGIVKDRWIKEIVINGVSIPSLN